MPKYMGYKPGNSSVGSPLGEPRLPKMRTQGDAKSSGPGSGTMKPALRERNSHDKPRAGRLATNSIKAPGSGTRGTGTAASPAPRT